MAAFTLLQFNPRLILRSWVSETLNCFANVRKRVPLLILFLINITLVEESLYCFESSFRLPLRSKLPAFTLGLVCWCAVSSDCVTHFKFSMRLLARLWLICVTCLCCGDVFLTTYCYFMASEKFLCGLRTPFANGDTKQTRHWQR